MSNAISASDARAEQLVAETTAIVERSLRYMPDDAFWQQRYAARASRFANEDGAFHVRYLADAIRASSPTVLEQYARWLRDLLVPRGMCTLHLAEHLDHVGRAAVDCVGEGQEGEYIRRAIASLQYEAGAPRAIQDAAQPIAAAIAGPAHGVVRHSAFETRYLCHYAADALHRGMPELLAKHLDWSRGALTPSRVEPAAYEHWIEKMRDALQAQGLPPNYLQ